MPHLFITINASSPNPGKWTRASVQAVCSRHQGTVEQFWHDDPANPSTAYALVRDGDPNAIRADLDAREILTLYPAS